VSCERESILLGKTELSVVFCLVKTLHKFNSRRVINRTLTYGDYWKCTENYVLDTNYTFSLQASTGDERPPTDAVKAKAVLLSNNQNSPKFQH
jgi:hypothetical protein